MSFFRSARTVGSILVRTKSTASSLAGKASGSAVSGRVPIAPAADQSALVDEMARALMGSPLLSMDPAALFSAPPAMLGDMRRAARELGLPSAGLIIDVKALELSYEVSSQKLTGVLAADVLVSVDADASTITISVDKEVRGGGVEVVTARCTEPTDRSAALLHTLNPPSAHAGGEGRPCRAPPQAFKEGASRCCSSHGGRGCCARLDPREPYARSKRPCAANSPPPHGARRGLCRPPGAHDPHACRRRHGARDVPPGARRAHRLGAALPCAGAARRAPPRGCHAVSPASASAANVHTRSVG